MNMSQNTVLITGGTSGIGRALAEELLARNNTVLITGRTEERLAETRQSMPGVKTYVCDQSDPAAVGRLCAEVVRDFPTLNVLINNAGIGLKRNLNDPDVPLGELEREIRSNLIGPIQMVQALLPHLKSQDVAMIVNVTSGLAFVPMGLKPIYCATKAGFHSYTQSLRVQISLSSVKVVELAPPAVATNLNKGQEEMNAKPRMHAKAFALAAIRGLERDKPEVLPGLAAILRLIARINPHAVLRRSEAQAMGSKT